MGIMIEKSKAGRKSKCNTITSIRRLNQITRAYGEEGLRFTIKTIQDAGWDVYDNAFVEIHLLIGYTAYPICKKNSDKYDILQYNLRNTTPNEFDAYAKQEYVQKTSSNHNEGSVIACIRDILR